MKSPAPVASAGLPVASHGAAPRVQALDGLRGLAILAALFHHLFVFEPAGRWGAVIASMAEFAAHGVDLFFALSGYLIIRQLSTGISRRGFLAEFWVKRFAKIAPIYLLAVSGAFLGLKYAFAWTGSLGKLPWLASGAGNWTWYLLFGSNLLNAFNGHFTNPALDVAWSLGIEVQFYILAVVAAMLVPRVRWPSLAWGAIVIAFLFRAGMLEHGANWVQVLVLTPGRLDAFAFGGLVALLPNLFARWPAWPVGALLLLPGFVGWSRTRPVCELFGYSAVAVASAILIDRATRPATPDLLRKALECRPLRLMGQISYSVYLTHLPLRAAMRDWFLGADRTLTHPSDWAAQLVFTLGAGVICVAVGWSVWRLVEEPVRSSIVNFYRGSRLPGTG